MRKEVCPLCVCFGPPRAGGGGGGRAVSPSASNAPGLDTGSEGKLDPPPKAPRHFEESQRGPEERDGLCVG